MQGGYAAHKLRPQYVQVVVCHLQASEGFVECKFQPRHIDKDNAAYKLRCLFLDICSDKRKRWIYVVTFILSILCLARV